MPLQIAQKYKRRNPIIFALQHDGSDESARSIESWVLLNGGKCELILSGKHQYDKEHAYIRLDSQRSANLVIPSSWVVKVDEGLFYAVLDVDFQILYEEISKPIDE